MLNRYGKKNVTSHEIRAHISEGSSKLIKFCFKVDYDDKNFKKFVNSEVCFNPHNMFICKSNLLKQYYETIFPWLKKCESLFGFNDTILPI